MRESAVFLAVVVTIALAGAAIATCAIRADAGMGRQQSVKIMRCYEIESDEAGEPIEVQTTPGAEYRLVATLAGVTRTLATIPCSDLPRTVSIGGAWPKGTVMGCALGAVCTPAVGP